MKTILLIDDDDDLRLATKLLLQLNNYHVVEAENGYRGVECAKRNQPDLIICDVQMPGIDGYTTLEQLHSEESTAIIPFIFLTGKHQKEDIRKGMVLGASDYLTKPFTEEELLKAVESRLSLKQQYDEYSTKQVRALRANISRALPHELRTPLTGLLGFAQLLKDDAAHLTIEELTEYGDFIFKSSNRIKATLEKFWLYTQLELRKTQDPRSLKQLPRNTIALIEAIKSVAEHKMMSMHRENDLILQLEEINGQIRIDDLQILIEELLDNAAKFSKSGQPITLSTHSEGESRILRIKDLGRGMSKAQINFIGAFMQFEREHYEQQGMGLGLIIAQRIAEINGGKLTIISEIGEGTEIVITFQNTSHGIEQ
ncbi:MAG: response regulator [bacterium]